jgi:hypothetical protein
VIRGGQGDDGPDLTFTSSPFGGVGGLLGGGGSDLIKGGADDDAMQGQGQNDREAGDTCVVDAGDITESCEL